MKTILLTMLLLLTTPTFAYTTCDLDGTNCKQSDEICDMDGTHCQKIGRV